MRLKFTPMANIIKRVIHYLNRGIWIIHLEDLGRYNSFFVKFIRVIYITLKGFYRDKISIRASALTFFSVLSVVPVLAMAFGIAQGFGIQSLLEKVLKKTFEGQQEIVNYILRFATQYLESFNGGYMALVSLSFLLYIFMKLLINIEESFNDIWHLKESRPFIRKFTDYLSMMLLMPFFVSLSSGLNVMSKYIIEATESIQLLSYFTSYILLLMRLIPYVLTWLLFMIFYMVMPNTNVKFSSALIAGIVAGSIYQIVQWAYIAFQVGVSRYNAIYGSFAALPLFLFWLQISWLIVLIGAKISYAIQHVDHYQYVHGEVRVSIFHRKVLSLSVLYHVIERFVKGESALTIPELSKKTKTSKQLVTEVINDLIEAGFIVSVTSGHSKMEAYQPAREPATFKTGEIIEKIEKIGEGRIPISGSEIISKIREIIELSYNEIKQSHQNKSLRDL